MIRVTCDDCGGSGTERCRGCGGSREVMNHVNDEWETCGSCDGSGHGDDDCNNCGGAGKHWVAVPCGGCEMCQKYVNIRHPLLWTYFLMTSSDS